MKFFKALKNLGKIKDYISILLVIVTKADRILSFLEVELKDTQIGGQLEKYLPKVEGAISVAGNALRKVISLFGIDAEVEVGSLEETTVEKECAQLDDALLALKNL